jgi:hypothetical protein
MADTAFQPVKVTATVMNHQHVPVSATMYLSGFERESDLGAPTITVHSTNFEDTVGIARPAYVWKVHVDRAACRLAHEDSERVGLLHHVGDASIDVTDAADVTHHWFGEAGALTDAMKGVLGILSLGPK